MSNVVTPTATLSFPSLFKPQPNKLDPSKPPQYSAMLTIPKTSDISQLVAAINAAVQAKWGTNPPANLRMPIRDGDVMAREKQDPWYAGKWVINAKANVDYPPQVVGMDRQPVIYREEIYAGCQVVAALNFFAYDAQVNRGVSAGLTAIMKVGDGERLDNRPNAQALFANVQVQGAPTPLVNAGVPNFGAASQQQQPAQAGQTFVPNFG